MKNVMKHYAPKFNMIKSILKKDDPTVVEIGAHYGEDSLRFLESFSKVNLICFEPDPRNIKMFKKYVNDERVKLFELALSNEKGKAKFYQSYQQYKQDKIPEKYDWIQREEYIKNDLNNSGSSSLKKGYFHVLDTPIEVETNRFDTWYKENNIGEIDFVWLDVQGAEREVIEGMGKEIENIKYFWLEYGETLYEGGMNRQDTIALMEEKGFKIVERYSDSTKQGDILCVNQKKIC